MNPRHHAVTARVSASPGGAPLTVTARPNDRIWAISLVRIFFGLVYLTNGLAKVTPLHVLDGGPFKSFLINFDDSRNILAHDVSSSIAPYRSVVENTILPNYDVVGHLLGVIEIAVGLGLILGLFGRLAALGGALLTLNVQIAAIGGGEWTYEYLVELVPLVMLAVVPCGHLAVLGRLPGLRRWLTPRLAAAPPRDVPVAA